MEDGGSLIAAVERLRGDDRTLIPFEPPEFNKVAKATARSEVADPDSADAPFEPMARHKLLRGLRLGR